MSNGKGIDPDQPTYEQFSKAVREEFKKGNDLIDATALYQKIREQNEKKIDSKSQI
jgi:hypothetical protein